MVPCCERVDRERTRLRVRTRHVSRSHAFGIGSQDHLTAIWRRGTLVRNDGHGSANDWRLMLVSELNVNGQLCGGRGHFCAFHYRNFSIWNRAEARVLGVVEKEVQVACRDGAVICT